jgi:hypothetical protein
MVRATTVAVLGEIVTVTFDGGGGGCVSGPPPPPQAVSRTEASMAAMKEKVVVGRT